MTARFSGSDWPFWLFRAPTIVRSRHVRVDMVNRLVVLANIASYRREDIGACRVGRERRSSDLRSPFSRQEWVRIAGLVLIRSGRRHEILEGVIRQFPPEVGNRKRSALAIR